MRTNSRLAVGSPTGRAAAILVATLLATLLIISAGIAGARLFAADGPIVVDQSGGGHYETISEALAMAADGDEILVRPGTYVEAVVIDKDVTLRGDGPVERIIITAPEDGPTSPLWQGVLNADPYALLVASADATISGLTFEGLGSEVILDGGSPTVSDSVFNDVGWAFDGTDLGPNGSSIVITGGGSPLISGNEIRNGGPIAIFDRSNATIRSNTLIGGPHLYLASFGDAVTIADNTVDGTHRWAIGSFFSEGQAEITGNTITRPGANGINMSSGSATIADNDISGASEAGIITGLQPVDVNGNRLTDNRVGVLFAARAGEVTNNTVRGGDVGITLSTSVLASGNDVEGATGSGILVSFGTPMLRDNRSCGNDTNLNVADMASPDIDESNEICEDAPAAA